jgi:hypothetical protein
LSVLEDLLVSAHITDARRHDRKAFELPADRRGVLWIADRGYSDHALFAEIADGNGYFLLRLKTSSLPTLTKIRSGVAKTHLHESLTPELPVWGVVDVDARFQVGRNKSRVFRVVDSVARAKTASPATSGSRRTCLTAPLPRTVGAFIVRDGPSKSVSHAEIRRSARRAALRQARRDPCVHRRDARRLGAHAAGSALPCVPSDLAVSHPLPRFALLLANLGNLVEAAAAGPHAPHDRRAPCRPLARGRQSDPGRPYARERHRTVEK